MLTESRCSIATSRLVWRRHSSTKTNILWYKTGKGRCFPTTYELLTTAWDAEKIAWKKKNLCCKNQRGSWQIKSSSWETPGLSVESRGERSLVPQPAARSQPLLTEASLSIHKFNKSLPHTLFCNNGAVQRGKRLFFSAAEWADKGVSPQRICTSLWSVAPNKEERGRQPNWVGGIKSCFLPTAHRGQLWNTKHALPHFPLASLYNLSSYKSCFLSAKCRGPEGKALKTI